MKKLLRTSAVCDRLGGISRQTLWRMVASGAFPPRRVLSNRPGISGWFEDEVTEYLERNALPVGAEHGDEEAR